METEQFKIILHRNAQKSLEKLPEHIRNQAQDAFAQLAKNPFIHPHIKKMGGYKNQYRYRIGNYRIVYQAEEKEVFILDIGARGDIYK